MTSTIPRIAVVGYASLDSVTSTPVFHGLDATSILRRPLTAAEPNIGGIAYIATALAQAGVQPAVVSWVGADAGGACWKAAVARGGSDVTGVAVSGTRSPATTLIEVDSGGTICLFYPGDCHLDSLTEVQRGVVERSDWLLITVAPRAITVELLDLLPASVPLAWAVKHDEDASPSDLVVRLLERADVVSFSAAERGYLTVDGLDPAKRMRAGTLLIETRGADGVAWWVRGGARGNHPVQRVDTDDTTGAGDTFVGALVGLLAAAGADADIPTAVGQASATASDLLRRRTNSGSLRGDLEGGC